MRTVHFERLRQERLEEKKLAHSKLGALVTEYETRAPHVTEAFKRRLLDAWWETRKAAHRHQLATERLVRHLGKGPLTYKGRVYRAQTKECIELEEVE